MKRNLLLILVLLPMVANADVEINETNFPDENFRNWVLGQSYGSDGVLTEEEISRIYYIDVDRMGIQSLKGIEAFTELKLLYCCFNKLTELDVTKNTRLTSLLCYGNQINSLNFKGCTSLTHLNCYRNRLKKLDVSECTKLNILIFFENSIGEIDVSKCAALTEMDCEDNYISELDVSGCPALKDLRCNGNNLRKLDVSGCPALTRLHCQENKIGSAAMEVLVSSLPEVENGSLYAISYWDEGNVITTNQVKAARKKGWTVFEDELNGGITTYHQYNGSSPESVVINDSIFPDEKFRDWLLAQPFGKDGELVDEEIAYITNIDVSGTEISSLQGIEFFTMLERLNCSNSQLTNFKHRSNMLREIDMSGCTALTELNCYDNWLTAVDVSGCTGLTTLILQKNRLTSLDVSGCTALTLLNCQSNRLTSLDVSGNAALTKLGCYNNQLTTLDVSKNAALTELECTVNQLTTLDLSKNAALSYLECSGNPLTTLDVSKNADLSSLICNGNQLTTLDVSNNTALGYLSCSSNQLTSLDVSKNTALSTLYCRNNQMTSLDVPHGPKLKELWCGNNLLTTLDVTDNTALRLLFCENNQLTTLNVSGCTSSLEEINCYQNQIKGAAMDELIEGLPYRWYSVDGKMVAVIENDQNVLNTSHVSEAKNKGWSVRSLTGGDYAGIDPNAKDVEINETNFPDENFRNSILSQSFGADGVLTPAEIAFYTRIHFDGKNIKDLKGIEFFTGISNLYCNDNQLTKLDLSKNKVLKTLDCSNNQLTSLDVSECKEVTTLDCSNNQLSRLDVSGCPKLGNLYCYKNHIRGIPMTELVESFQSTNVSKRMYVIYSENEGNAMTRSQVKMAQDKAVYPWAYVDGTWVSFWWGTELLTEEFFPDANFRAWIQSQPYGADGDLSDEELASITTIDVSGKNIRSLEGIDFFQELKTLKCNNNLLSELDMSRNPKLANLYCYNNRLTRLDVSGCNELTYLNSHSNRLKGEAVDALVEALPVVSKRNWYVIDNENANEQNVMTALQVENAKDKGWTPFWRNGGWQEYAGSDPDGIESLTPDPSPMGEGSWYDLYGRKINSFPSGRSGGGHINIIRYSDGSSRKVLVK